MKPRYKPTYDHNGAEEFLGRAGELDVWTELNQDYTQDERWIILVGPRKRKLKAGTTHNFDVYPVENNMLSSRQVADDDQDIHVELHETCQVYELCVKHGYITVLEKADGI
jgi:hypothetical protein